MNMMRIIAKCCFTVLLILIYTTLPDVRHLIAHNPSTTAFIELRRAEAQAKHIPFDLEWEWTSLNQISPFLVSLVIFYEDPDFWTHKGFNWKNIAKALGENCCHQRFKRGGSSISQQTVKNLFLYPNKSLFRKIREGLITCQLEHHLTKQRILEIYLNIAEWGNGIFGIKAAARHWFNKSPSQLSLCEALYLVSILPSPLKS